MNTQFAVAVHILALMAMNMQEHITSAYMAKSVNTNPVVIRRITALLKRAGLIEVKAGVGGAYFLKSPDDIDLSEVFMAIKAGSGHMVPLHDNTNQECYVGANIHDALEMPLAKLEQAVLDSLKTTTIADICAFIRARRDIGYRKIYYS